MAKHKARDPIIYAMQQPADTSQLQRLDRGQVVAAIDRVSASLLGPMRNLDRALLVADRRDLRARLAEIDGQS